jgi:very-short-patch-repair endonuclease
MRFEQKVLELAETQHSAIATWQLRAIGLGREEIRRLRTSSAWDAVSKRVMLRSGTTITDSTRLMAAVLDASPGASVAGPTGAFMWGARGFRLEPIHVVRPKGVSRRPSTLAVVHEVVDLHPSHIKVLNGIPVVSPGRVVCELAASHPHRAERVLDWFWTEHLLDGRTFGRTVGEMRDRGRKGSTFFRELDAARGPDYVPPASGLEKRFMEICPWPMRRQVDSGGEEWCGRVDFRDLELPLIVEVQSEKYHTALVDRVADANRKARLEAAGYTIVEVWDTEVWHRPDDANERVRKARWTLQARRSPRTGDEASTDL